MTGLIISAALVLIYFSKKRKWEEEQQRILDEAAKDLPDLDNYGIDYNDTTMPDGLQLKASMVAGDWDTKKNTFRVGVGLDFIRTSGDKTKKLYIHSIQVNGKIGGSEIIFDSAYRKERDGYYYLPGMIWYKNNGSCTLQYNKVNFTMGGGTVTTTANQLQNIKKIAEEKQKKTLRDIATVDVLIQYSWVSSTGDANTTPNKRWKTGIVQGLKCTLIAN